jgi:hypothetical protein
MESLLNCEIIIDIDVIENISGANQNFEIIFLTKDKARKKIILKLVWDMRYSIENASIDRFCEFRKRLPKGIIDNGVYIVKDSEYIKYFEHQISGTYPTDGLKHYIFIDNTDTILDILTLEKPVILDF